MTQLEFDKRLSLGNLLTIGAVLFAMAGAWFTMGEVQRAQSRELTSLDNRVSILEQSLQDVMQQISNERLNQTRILTEMQADVRYLRTSLDELRDSRG